MCSMGNPTWPGGPNYRSSPSSSTKQSDSNESLSSIHRYDKRNSGNAKASSNLEYTTGWVTDLSRTYSSTGSMSRDQYIDFWGELYSSRVMETAFVVLGGTCECSEGVHEALIDPTHISSMTMTNGLPVLTLECKDMWNEDIFGACKKLTEAKEEEEGEVGEAVQCKDKHELTTDEWQDPGGFVKSNMEGLLTSNSTLKCGFESIS